MPLLLLLLLQAAADVRSHHVAVRQGAAAERGLQLCLLARTQPRKQRQVERR
jgi:hypothetical protein